MIVRVVKLSIIQCSRLLIVVNSYLTSPCVGSTENDDKYRLYAEEEIGMRFIH